MKSITIHNLDDELALAIRNKARTENLSLNKTLKKILSQSLIQKKKTGTFDKYFGTWTHKEAIEFDKRIVDMFEQVDPEDWK